MDVNKIWLDASTSLVNAEIALLDNRLGIEQDLVEFRKVVVAWNSVISFERRNLHQLGTSVKSRKLVIPYGW